jgi:hypothetical protein
LTKDEKLNIIHSNDIASQIVVCDLAAAEMPGPQLL